MNTINTGLFFVTVLLTEGSGRPELEYRVIWGGGGLVDMRKKRIFFYLLINFSIFLKIYIIFE